MKKLLCLLLLASFLTSCGPRRLKCGVGRRCLVELPKEKPVIVTSNSQSVA